MRLKAGEYWGPLSDTLITSVPVHKHSVEFILGNNLAVRTRKQHLDNVFWFKILINQENAFMCGIACSCLPSFSDRFAVGSLAHPAQITLPILNEHRHPSLPPCQPCGKDFFPGKEEWMAGHWSLMRWEVATGIPTVCESHGLRGEMSHWQSHSCSWPRRGLTQLS